MVNRLDLPAPHLHRCHIDPRLFKEKGLSELR